MSIILAFDVSLPTLGPSGLVQPTRSAGTMVTKSPLVLSDSDSEEEEGLVTRLIPTSCPQQSASCTEGVSTMQNTPSVQSRVFDELSIVFHILEGSCNTVCFLFFLQVKEKHPCGAAATWL